MDRVPPEQDRRAEQLRDERHQFRRCSTRWSSSCRRACRGRTHRAAAPRHRMIDRWRNGVPVHAPVGFHVEPGHHAGRAGREFHVEPWDLQDQSDARTTPSAASSGARRRRPSPPFGRHRPPTAAEAPRRFHVEPRWRHQPTRLDMAWWTRCSSGVTRSGTAALPDRRSWRVVPTIDPLPRQGPASLGPKEQLRMSSAAPGVRCHRRRRSYGETWSWHHVGIRSASVRRGSGRATTSCRGGRTSGDTTSGSTWNSALWTPAP
jgi:hypothetical protein